MSRPLPVDVPSTYYDIQPGRTGTPSRTINGQNLGACMCHGVLDPQLLTRRLSRLLTATPAAVVRQDADNLSMIQLDGGKAGSHPMWATLTSLFKHKKLANWLNRDNSLRLSMVEGKCPDSSLSELSFGYIAYISYITASTDVESQREQWKVCRIRSQSHAGEDCAWFSNCRPGRTRTSLSAWTYHSIGSMIIIMNHKGFHRHIC